MAIGDRALVSGTNFVVTIIVAKSVGVAQYGSFVLLSTVLLFSTGIQSALILNPMRVLAVSNDHAEEQRDTVNQAHLQIRLCLLLSLVVLAGGYFTDIPIALLSIFVVAVTLLQIQEFVRSTFLIRGNFSALLQLDGTSLTIRLGIVASAAIAGILDLRVAFAAMAVSFLFGVRFLCANLLGEASKSIRRVSVENWTHARWLLLETLLYSISVQAYLFIAARELGAEAAGGIGAIQNIFNAANVIQLGLIGYYTPALRRLWLRDAKTTWIQIVVRLALLLVSIMGFLTISLYWAGEEILEVIYKPEFAKYKSVVPLLGAFYCLGSINTVLNMAFRTADKPEIGFRAKLLSSIVALLAGIPLVQKFGIEGAASGLAITQIIWAIAYAISLSNLNIRTRS
ncbi:MAG: lipopolysaccharide biosynthesis protein [Nitrospiraceae bacterium]